MTNIEMQIFQDKVQKIVKNTAVTMLEIFKLTVIEKKGCSWVFYRFLFDRRLGESVCMFLSKNVLI